MKKRLLLLRMTALLVGLSMAIGASAADVYDFTYNNLQFVITGSTTAKVVGPVVEGPTGSWIVPATATNSSTSTTYIVTEIGEDAFRDCSAITSMTIGSNVTKIASCAFLGCSGLTKMTIPNSVTSVNGLAFSGCTGLRSVIIGTNCRFYTGYSWSLNVFEGCSNLDTITCLSEEAWEFHEPMFEESVYANALLRVPSGSESAYQNTNYWNKFSHIQGLPNLDEALNIPGGTIHFTSSGEYLWIVETEGDRTYAKSGNAGSSNSTSTLAATVTVAGACTLSFDFKAWGEGSSTAWDKCIFSIDGTAQFTYGAFDNDWTTYEVDIPAGTHTLTWSYTKDSSVNPTGDYFAIDNVRIREKTAMRGDVNSDGAVDINDVTKLINYVLTGDATGVDRAAADVDYSTHVDINDVTALINYILSGAWPTPTFTVGGVTFKMIPVSGGTFMMGARDGEPSAGSYEKPLHQVTLSSFSIGETEVTQALWLAVMGSNPSYFTGDLNRPVEKVSWGDCQTFITKLNQMTGGNFRLPTEAEWEFAARGGNQSVGYIYAGSDTPDDVAWYSDNSGSTTHPVAQKQANELGLYDMSGNVSEWCSDWYDSDYYSVSPSVNPTGPESGYQRVSRGGNHGNDAIYIRVAFRNNPTPGSSQNTLGLRLAM